HPRQEPLPSSGGESGAGEVFGVAVGAVDFVFDADAAVGQQLFDAVPVDVPCLRGVLQLRQQGGDEVDARFDGDDHARLQGPGHAQVGVTLGARDQVAVLVTEAGDVVHLQAD